MSEQAIEAFARLVWRTEKSPEAHFPILKRELVRQAEAGGYAKYAMHFAERALTAEVALAEAREALTSAKMYLELNHIAGKTAAKSDCDGCRVLSAAAAWLELHKEKGTR